MLISHFIFFLLCLFVSQQLIQCVKAEIPAGRALGDPVLGRLESRGPHADHVDPSGAPAVDKAGLLKHTKMSGDGRQRDAKWLGQRSDRPFSVVRKAYQDAAARGAARAAKMAVIFFRLLTK
jgi:hypothetical protein